MPIQTSIDVKT